jgi:nitric oxide reductase subunit B
MALQKWRGNVYMSAGLEGNGWKWKWALGLLNGGVVGMTIALLISGYDQAFIERALGGATWAAYFDAQNGVWFIQGLWWRQLFGFMTAAGLIILIWDLLTIGRNEKRSIQLVGDNTAAEVTS